MSSDISPGGISVRGLSKKYKVPSPAPATMAEAVLSKLRGRSRADSFWALKDVSFDVPAGEAVALIGSNGAGKSTLLKVLSRITAPTAGDAYVGGAMSALLEVGTGFHPELTGRENVFLNGSILGMSRASVRRSFDEIVEFAGVAPFIDLPVKRYSSGMTMRLAFSVASCLTAPILIIDEVLAVGDAAFQDKCLGRMNDAVGQGRTVLFVSHNMAAVRALCTRGILLQKGGVAYDGPVDAAIDAYLGNLRAVSAGDEPGVFDLSKREDGSSRPHLRKITVGLPGRGPSEHIPLGEALYLELDVADWGSLRNVEVAISIWNATGVMITALMSQFSPVRIAHDGAERLAIRVDLDRVDLLPGRYSLDIGLRRPGEADFDLATSGAAFTVVEADFFGNGRLPTSGEGLVATPQRWSVSDRTSAD